MPAKGSRQAFCIHGHDISIVGRDNGGHCKGCVPILSKKSRKKTIKIVKKRAKIYQKVNKLEIKRKKHLYHKANRERFLAYSKRYYEEHKKRILKRTKKYRQNHRKEFNAQIVLRRVKNINFRLSCNLRSRLNNIIKNNSKKGSAVKDLGCSIEFLVAYLQEQFYGDMSWDNYGSYWEIDHIEELHTFDLSSRKQFLKAVNYTNLQPLTIPDHKKKTAGNWYKR